MSLNLSGKTYQDPEELFQFVGKHPEKGYECTICQIRFQARVTVRNHVESKHFPNMFTYTCNICFKDMTSKNAKATHMSIYHRDFPKI